MKKQFLLLLLIGMISTGTFAQGRLGYSLAEVKIEFKYGYEQQVTYDKDGDEIVSITLENAWVWHYFNSDNVCYYTVVQPKNLIKVQGYVETYNKVNVVMSATEWRWYNNGIIAEIKLITDSEGKTYFNWSFLQQ